MKTTLVDGVPVQAYFFVKQMRSRTLLDQEVDDTNIVYVEELLKQLRIDAKEVGIKEQDILVNIEIHAYEGHLETDAEVTARVKEYVKENKKALNAEVAAQRKKEKAQYLRLKKKFEGIA